jgi:hypothetical protein
MDVLGLEMRQPTPVMSLVVLPVLLAVKLAPMVEDSTQEVGPAAVEMKSATSCLAHLVWMPPQQLLLLHIL